MRSIRGPHRGDTARVRYPLVPLDSLALYATHLVAIDANFYRNFWSLQKFFQNPSLAFEGDNWKTLSSGIDAVLLAFKENPITKEEAAAAKYYTHSTKYDDNYFTKYLTSSRLLPLQVCNRNTLPLLDLENKPLSLADERSLVQETYSGTVFDSLPVSPCN